MRVLIIEDDHKIANSVRKGLQNQSYAVDVCYEGIEGLNTAKNTDYDLIILDRMLPGMDGLEILTTLRKEGNHTPVLLLTAKDHVLERAAGLNAGADDYLVKPFAFVELIARVRALLRRPQQAQDVKLTYKDVVLDPDTFSVTRSGKQIVLSQKEFALLEYLMNNPGRVLSKEAIMEHVWNYDSDILPNTVEVYIGYLRTKIDKPFSKSPTLIHTRRGFGYVFGEIN
ncbi:MAG: response regulator transcription factor [Candidatus Nomurabacteria bacterium]|nr:response regulator transcription factor [Candidatus Saccharibacteria bacterium]USN95558.1 MAG: response regulator transcription factor [Candidatus Nomurabacteria bacterium]